MTLFSLARAYLKDKPSSSLLHIALMALGVMLMTSLFLLGHQLEQRLYRDSAGIDVVIGAKGSPLQLILSSIQHIDIPTGNIPLKEARRIQKHPHIRQAIPISLGDSFHGFRIVGTEPSYVEHFGGELAAGRLWQDSLQAVLGSRVAAESGLSVGDRFSGSHGLVEGGHAHDEHPYHVVGILAETGTVLDRLIVTSLESVWDLHREEEHHHEDADEHDDHDDHDEYEEHHHEHHDHDAKEDLEVTALLASYRNRSAVMSFPRYINQQTSMQAASPAFEMARLIELIGVGADTVMLFGVLLVGVSLLSVFIALLNSIRDRRYDLAIFRTLGASRGALFRLVLIEGLILALLGSVIGVIAGHAVIELMGMLTEKGREMGLTGFLFLPSVLWLWAGVIAASALACLIPAWQASKAEIFTLLRQAG